MALSFKKVILVIIDGFGVASESKGNAITRAGMPALSDAINHFPALTLQAAGPNVGLPWGEPGNSEVGHLCLGAGRVVLQDGPRIDASIVDGSFNDNPVFRNAFAHIKKTGGTLHLAGLIGEGGVHSSQLHLYALLNLAKESGINNLAVHAFTDGRDSSPTDSLQHVKSLERKMIEIGLGKIVSVTGRFYAMDRGLHWDLTESAYRALTEGIGERSESALAAIERNYANNIFDETIPPTIIVKEGQKPNTVGKGDALIFFNFRPDRSIQLTRAFVQPNAVLFKEKPIHLQDLFVATLTEFARDLPVEVAFPKVKIENSLSKVLQTTQKKQYHIAEREKYAHVTYFFDCGADEPGLNETWDILKSQSQYLDRYQNVPQMSAPELTAKLISKLDEDQDFYLVNYANPDMVGHTGNLEASIKAAEAIDNCIKQIVEKVLARQDTLMLIVADHGNIETLIEEHTGRINTSHTTNPVPFVAIGQGLQIINPRKGGYIYLATQVPEGLLADVAPTILEAFGVQKPIQMTGVSLLSVFLQQIKNSQELPIHTGQERSVSGVLER